MAKGKFCGIQGYAKLMAQLRDQPATISEFRARYGLSYCGAYRFIDGLHCMGRAHVIGWELASRVRPLPIYAFGPGEDAPCPPRTLKGRATKGGTLRRNRAPSATLIALDYLLRECEAHPTTIQQMIEVTGVGRAALRAAVRQLVRDRMVHIGGWDSSTARAAIPAYSIGPGRNVTRPKRSTRSEINAKHWARRAERLRFNALHRAIVPQAAMGEVRA